MITTRTEKLRHLVPLIVREPGELYDRILTKFETRADRQRQQSYEYAPISFSEGLARLSGMLEIEAETILGEEAFGMVSQSIGEGIERLRTAGPFAPAHNGDVALGSIAYYVCRALRPEVVIETGVAYGVTSTCLLQALAQNGTGGLWSIDLPPLGRDAAAHVGTLVPASLRDRWQLNRGVSRRLLPRVLAQLGRVDVFIHDSLHTYSNMLWEFETIWPVLAPGGMLIADDAGDNGAFADFASKVSPACALVIQEEGKSSLCGVLQKPR